MSIFGARDFHLLAFCLLYVFRWIELNGNDSLLLQEFTLYRETVLFLFFGTSIWTFSIFCQFYR